MRPLDFCFSSSSSSSWASSRNDSSASISENRLRRGGTETDVSLVDGDVVADDVDVVADDGDVVAEDVDVRESEGGRARFFFRFALV